MSNAECDGISGPGSICASNNAATDIPGMGCCPAATTTSTVATTAASAVTTKSTCVDLLNPVTGVSDCPARANLCTNSVYLAVQCRRTCGFCSTSTGTKVTSRCVDLTIPSTGISDCPARRGYCNNSIYAALMRVQCPATCGFC